MFSSGVLALLGVTPGIWVPSCLSLLGRLEQTCFVGVPLVMEDHDEKVARSLCAGCVSAWMANRKLLTCGSAPLVARLRVSTILWTMGSLNISGRASRSCSGRWVCVPILPGMMYGSSLTCSMSLRYFLSRFGASCGTACRVLSNGSGLDMHACLTPRMWRWLSWVVMYMWRSCNGLFVAYAPALIIRPCGRLRSS